jgi:hypothetical protein
MTVYITEYVGGFLSGRQAYPGLAVGVPIQSQELTTGSTYTLSANTHLIMVSADAGSWLLLTSSGSTQVASTSQSSTNPSGACLRVPSGLAPFPVVVQPNMRLLTNST